MTQLRPAPQSAVDLHASPRAPRCGGAASTGVLPLLLPPELLMEPLLLLMVPELLLMVPLLLPPPSPPVAAPAVQTLPMQASVPMQSPVVRHDSPVWLECGT